MCSLVDTCASEVAQCDWTMPPDETFASCTDLRKTDNPKPTLRRFTGNVTGTNTSSYFIEETSGARGPFVLYIAPQFSGDYWNSACFYVFSYLAKRGIATFVATIPDLADANRDSWNHLPSSGAQPYPSNCAHLNPPICDNQTGFLHDRHIEDVLAFAESLGYSVGRSAWWGYSIGAAEVSQHLNYRLQRRMAPPAALVLEATGGQYCYAFAPDQLKRLQADTPYWKQCVPGAGLFASNCCPQGLTEQFYFEQPERYPQHPATLLVQADGDLTCDPDGLRFYNETMQRHGARSATATWGGTAHGITPHAFGMAAAFVRAATGQPVGGANE